MRRHHPPRRRGGRDGGAGGPPEPRPALDGAREAGRLPVRLLEDARPRSGNERRLADRGLAVLAERGVRLSNGEGAFRAASVGLVAEPEDVRVSRVGAMLDRVASVGRARLGREVDWSGPEGDRRPSAGSRRSFGLADALRVDGRGVGSGFGSAGGEAGRRGGATAWRSIAARWSGAATWMVGPSGSITAERDVSGLGTGGVAGLGSGRGGEATVSGAGGVTCRGGEGSGREGDGVGAGGAVVGACAAERLATGSSARFASGASGGSCCGLLDSGGTASGCGAGAGPPAVGGGADGRLGGAVDAADLGGSPWKRTPRCRIRSTMPGG